jgi:hypothetical protein
MPDSTEEALIRALSQVLLRDDGNENVDGLDEDLVSYISGVLAEKVCETDEGTTDRSTVDDLLLKEIFDEVLNPFLESVDCPERLIQQAQMAIKDVLQVSSSPSTNSPHLRSTTSTTTRKLTQGVVSMSSDMEKRGPDHEADANRYLWGTSTGIKAMANDIVDAHDSKASAKDKRKARKQDASAARKLLSSQHDADLDEDGSGGLVRMNVRSVTGQANLDKARDVQVRNVTLSLHNGTVLLENGELRFAYRRRYGLIGENGVGKVHCLSGLVVCSRCSGHVVRSKEFLTHLKLFVCPNSLLF